MSEDVIHIVLKHIYSPRIRLKNLNEQTDLKALSEQTIKSCNLIAPSRLPEIKHLLKYLRDRTPKAVILGEINNFKFVCVNTDINLFV